MIIQILSNLYDEGYVRAEKYTLISPFFAGANVAFRRQAIGQAGPYDENCVTGEDQDMCLRIANIGWELYFEPRAKIRHKNRLTLRSLVRQWFNYGFNHPYLFKKYNSKHLEVYRPKKKNKKGNIYKCIFKRWFPFHTVIFITPFFVLHIFLILAILCILLGLDICSIVFGSITLAIATFYFKSDINIRHLFRSISFIFLRYIANLSLLLGGFLGGLKLGIIHISATLDYRI